MRCELCGRILDPDNEYTVNGRKVCKNCYDSTVSMFNLTLGDIENQVQGVLFSHNHLRCDNCGTTLRDISKTGELGCLNCYVVFMDTITKLLMKKQGEYQYSGRNVGERKIVDAPGKDDRLDGEVDVVDAVSKKTPEAALEDTEYLSRIEKADLGMLELNELARAKEMALERENYILAARLRDEMKRREEK